MGREDGGRKREREEREKQNKEEFMKEGRREREMWSADQAFDSAGLQKGGR